MRFAQPQFLWLLLVLPPGLTLFFWWSWRRQQQLAQRFIQARLLPGLTVGLSAARRRFRMGCLVAAVACLLVALARPQWGFTWEEVRQRGLDIVIGLDVSKSMLATDVAPNRLARAKLAALDLLRQAKADRVGLVAFAGTAFLQCPLTLDDAIFRQSLEVLDVQTISQGGTALAEAIETALQAFKEEDNHKVLVLLTDGEDHDSGALEAAQQAAKAGLRIFTVGVGTPEGELLRVKNAQGREDYVRDEQGNVVKSRLNETLLQQIAGATEGGFYLPLRGPKVMETLYERGLAPLPKFEGAEKFVRRYHERFHWPLAMALVLLVLEMLWPEAGRASREVPEAAAGQRPLRESPTAAQAATAVLLLALPVAAQASPSSALRDYEAGRYDEALRSYQRLLEKHGDDPRLRFNAGAAAYRSRQFGEAAKQFEEATRASDLHLQEHAYYNLGNTLYRTGETAEDLQKTIEAWEGALQQYERALRLNTNNADARFNRDFVKRKLEELKQQQQQQQNQKDPSEQQNQSQDQQQKQPDRQEQKQEQQQPQDKPRQEGQQDQPQQEPESPPPDQPQQENRPKPGDEQDQQKPQPSGKPEDQQQPSEEEQREAQARQAGQMTPQEARKLLDSLKGDEQLLWFKPESPTTSRARSPKDW